MPVPPLWKRVLLLPFLPPMWAQARHWPVSAVIVPLFLSATLWSGGLGVYRAIDFRRVLDLLAGEWESRFDPLVIENGEARVEGTRLPEGGENGALMLADPEETRKPPTDRRYLIVRKHEVIRSDGPPVDLKVIEDMVGGSVRIDGDSIRAWLTKWGLAMQAGLVAFLVFFEWLATLMALLYGLLSGAVLMALFGKSRGLTSAHCARIGLATMAVKPVLGVALGLLGTGVHACLGLFLWPVVGVVLGLIALSLERAPAAEA